ncbi:50S ribosomal protein L3 [Dubosiella newyorkensis]|jgi:large subunit ribosomal protein L3|uniref:Large ribosomal subunit protein uL3 n=1 Tax=Dubosiella newyorkensis TaxID=1862672 RepID=A0A1U7NLE4_9FIRM|nr:50S ribosomal protein L3 [Dubosiella newyorkensis]MCI9041746.1 50S ribosomal protein L3 [Dubosiella newyorkensis]OLU45548.1 50S ribosomal protein L3 [Dubosiella newyorkensis]
MKGLLGRKLGMTQVFSEDGELIPVTVVEATPNVVLQVKTTQTDGYEAVQLGFEDIKERRATKANIGHTKKAGTGPKRFVREVRDCELDLNVGDTVSVNIFEPGETVDVIGTSKGKGYQGTIVRNNAHQGPKTHGGSKNIRHIGSLATNGITSRQGRIMKGTVMAGQEGGYRTTNPNLTVIKVDPEKNYLLIKGCVPGPKKGLVMVRTAKTSKGNKAPVTLVDYTVNEEVSE